MSSKPATFTKVNGIWLIKVYAKRVSPGEHISVDRNDGTVKDVWINKVFSQSEGYWYCSFKDRSEYVPHNKSKPKEKTVNKDYRNLKSWSREELVKELQDVQGRRKTRHKRRENQQPAITTYPSLTIIPSNDTSIPFDGPYKLVKRSVV